MVAEAERGTAETTEQEEPTDTTGWDEGGYRNYDALRRYVGVSSLAKTLVRGEDVPEDYVDPWIYAHPWLGDPDPNEQDLSEGWIKATSWGTDLP